MGNYSSLKATINANVKANNNQEITGNILNSVLNAMVDSVGAGYQYLGIATPTSPGTDQTPDYRCFYIATTPGTYSHLGGLVVNDGEVAVLKYDSTWHKDVTGAATAAQLTELGQKSLMLHIGDADSVTNQYISSTGALTNSSSWTAWKYINRGYVSVNAHTYTGTLNTYYGIAFYNSETPSAATFISGQMMSAVNNVYKDVTIPSGTKLIIISSRTATAPADNSTASIQLSAAAIQKNFETKDVALDAKIEDLATVFLDFSQSFVERKAGYIETTGAFNASAVWDTKLFENKGFRKVSAKVGVTAEQSGICAVAFFAGNPFDSSLTPISYQTMYGGIVTYLLDVPAGCTYITVSNRTPNLEDSEFKGMVTIANYSQIAPDEKFGVKVSFGKEYAFDRKELYYNLTTNVFQASTAFETYYFDAVALKATSIEARLGGANPATAAILFYSSYDLIQANLISSVAFLTGANNYNVDVPSGCKVIVIFNRTSTLIASSITIYSARQVSTRGESLEFESSKEEYGIVLMNHDLEPIIKGSSAFSGRDYAKIAHKYLTLLHATDLHGDQVNNQRVLDFVNNYPGIYDCVLDSGDIATANYASTSFESMYVAKINDINVPNLFCIGNHETGYSPNVESLGGGYNTIANIVLRYITPYMSQFGCVQGNNGGYYYKDFSAYNIRLISLFEYEIPRIVNENTPSEYLYGYWDRYISQDQADWLVSTLNSVPERYSVIIMMHQMPDMITPYTDNPFMSEDSAAEVQTAQGPIIQDIIDAYISKTTLTKTYANTKGYPSSDVPDVSVSADFTSANGEFICYLCGHSHTDRIGQSSVAVNKQVVICLTTSGITKSQYDDMYRVVQTRSQDCFNHLVFDTDKKRIRILRIGARVTLNMTKREMTCIDYLNP